MHGVVLETAHESVRRALADPAFPPMLAAAIRSAPLVVYLLDVSTGDELAIGSNDLPRALRQARTVLHGRRCSWRFFTSDYLQALGLEVLGPLERVEGIGRA